MTTKTGQDFELWSGDHRTINFAVTDGSGVSVNLTGACGVWVLANDAKTASILRLTSDSGCGMTLSGCTATVSLSPAHTSGLQGIYYHELQIKDSGSNISTVAVGTVTINQDVATSS